MVAADAISVCVVCCGAPKRGMGWYHCKQLLDGRVSGAQLTDVVEPFFLGPGSDTPAAAEFSEWAKANPSVGFHKSISDTPAISSKKLVIICGRTVDNPRLFKEAIDHGFTHVYLEKPGAPSSVELEEMSAYATSKGVPVFMGYNRNFSKYILSANEHMEKAATGCSLTLGRNDCFNTPEAVDECFERNSEGMMKNMMVHELVTLITYHGLTVDKITSVVADPAKTKIETRRGFTDFSQVGFTLKTSADQEFIIWGDRCNGEYGEAVVRNADGEELFKSVRPDEAISAKSKELEDELPGCMPYFYLQDGEYLALKEAVISSIASGTSERPTGVAGIDTAVESVKICEHITSSLMEAAKGLGGAEDAAEEAEEGAKATKKRPAAAKAQGKAKAKAKGKAKGKAVAKDIKKKPAARK